MTDEKKSGDVIDLAEHVERKKNTLPLRTGVKPGRRICGHRGAFVVDSFGREVFCDECGATIDPIEYLFGLANECDWVVAMRAERSKLEDEIAKLKRERTNLRQQVKRATR